mgnify:CR=1 FL=1
MKNHLKFINLVLLLLGSFSSIAFAATGSITIISPKYRAVVKADKPSVVTYKVNLGTEGNHLHVYIDDQKPIVDRNVTGCPCSVELPGLSAGNHTVVIKEARADHSLTGVQSAIEVTAK